MSDQDKKQSCITNEEKVTVEPQTYETSIDEGQNGSDKEDNPDGVGKTEGTAQPEEPSAPYSTFTKGEKISITLLVSFLAIISPLSGQIYLPALDAIAQSLDVPISYINLTITTFMVRSARFHTAVRGTDIHLRSSKALPPLSSAISPTSMVVVRHISSASLSMSWPI